MSFEHIIKSLPAETPGDIKSLMLDLYSKHPKEFIEPDIESMTPKDFPATPHNYRKNSNVLINKPMSSMYKSMSIDTRPVQIMRSGHSGATSPDNGQVATTATPENPKNILLPMYPQRFPMAVPMSMPFYPRIPVMIPMKSYFEPVVHDHPPLYKIKEMIEADKKLWKKASCANNKDSDTSSEIKTNHFNTDTDTDTSSDDVDVGSEYYDTVLKIMGRR